MPVELGKLNTVLDGNIMVVRPGNEENWLEGESECLWTYAKGTRLEGKNMICEEELDTIGQHEWTN